MALNFPTSPTTNQIFSDNGKTWKYDGTAWRTLNVTGITGGGTGLTAINAGNAFLSSNSAGTALTYRQFLAGSGVTFSLNANSITIESAGSGFVTGTGTSAYVPLWTDGGTSLTDSIMQQIGDIVVVAGSIKAQTKSFKIQHPLDPNKYLEHGSLEGPEHGIYQRGRASGKGTVLVISRISSAWAGINALEIQLATARAQRDELRIVLEANLTAAAASGRCAHR